MDEIILFLPLPNELIPDLTDANSPTDRQGTTIILKTPCSAARTYSILGEPVFLSPQGAVKHARRAVLEQVIDGDQ
jgi:hypothetical protein